MSRPRRRGVGRPEHVPDKLSRLTVQIMVASGIPQERICVCLGIVRATLRKHYKVTMARASDECHWRVAANLYRIATGNGRDAVPAAKFWLMCRQGQQWRETLSHEVGGSGIPVSLAFRWADAVPSQMVEHSAAGLTIDAETSPAADP